MDGVSSCVSVSRTLIQKAERQIRKITAWVSKTRNEEVAIHGGRNITGTFKSSARRVGSEKLTIISNDESKDINSGNMENRK